MTHQSTTAEVNKRTAGVLLHPTSLPGQFGIGELGDEVIVFLDWARRAGLKIWQVLPLNAPGYGNSPYGCLSSYAGNPLLISPLRLVRDGLLPHDAIDALPESPAGHIDFERVGAMKNELLRYSFVHFTDQASSEQQHALASFVRDNNWLHDWALYAALRESSGGAPWQSWPHGLAAREPEAMAAAREELSYEVRFHEYVQWLFFKQWATVREAAHERGIRIMGDVPIYVAADSADVWASREIFQLDERGDPTVVAGVPPDYFSETGQRWGNPLYRWDLLHETNYAWWVARFQAALRFADILRVDHFRGFSEYWEIPADEPTAIHGHWMPGPGRALFDAIRDAVGDLPVVAEDLGHITSAVHELRSAIGVPGMKILQFAFAQPNSPHLPHHYDPKTVVYTGTHDNDTARGWYDLASDEERHTANLYLGVTTADAVPWTLIRAAYTSVAETAIVPAQDLLNLGSDARMNIPGAENDNWSWRLTDGALTDALADLLSALAKISGRI